MEMAQRLAEVLCLARIRAITTETAEQVFKPFLGDGMKLVHRTRGEFIAHVGHPIRKVYVLLCGECYIFNYSVEGESVMTGRCAAPQLFGLFELIEGIAGHTATIEVLTQSCFLEVPQEVYMSCLEQEKQVMYYSLRYLASFISRTLNRSDHMMLNTGRQNLLLYFYENCKGVPLPVCLPVSKAELAEEVNQNLRTLYRALHTLRQEGLIGRRKGKVVIDAQQYQRICEQIKNLI